MIGWEVVVAEAVAVIAAVRGTWSPCGLSMISAINPFSERSRGHRYWLTAAWFVVGANVGGAVLGGAAAVLAAGLAPLQDYRGLTLAAGVVGCLVTMAADLRLLGFGLPTHPRQVNERWLGRYRRWLYASGFGFQIGVGFSTYIMTAATYLLVLLAALSAAPAVAFGVGLTFGLVRGLLVLIGARAKSPSALRQLHERLDTLAPWSMRAAIAGQGAAAVVLTYVWDAGRGLLLLAIVFAAVAYARTRPPLSRRRSRTSGSRTSPARVSARSAGPR